ncbi:MAG TPA: AbrB/MazE/SpoVT family DNA-binding domain-containing protein [Candidatus Norongarragalinales archaeon]|nr:AbrB/MazE/SpoVT family DNA-binding domain-containing protein [Candidatus Norongarragalinales archaeon]
MHVKAKVRKWGNSLGLVLPKEVVDAEGIKENQEIDFYIPKKVDLSKVFGTLKTKMTGQAFKDSVRDLSE